jgi:JmjC domain, hydroxylase
MQKTSAEHVKEETPLHDEAVMEVDDVVAPEAASSPSMPVELKAEDVATQTPLPGTTKTADGAPVANAKIEAELAANAAAKKARAERDHARRHAKVAQDEAFMEAFDPKAGWLPPGTSPDDYTPEFCKTLERMYWRGCGIGKPALYGADMAGSLFDDATTEWNVANLPSVLSRLLPLGAKVPGVNTPYLYWGMWRATFAWHVEDMDLFSINYIHFGVRLTCSISPYY